MTVASLTAIGGSVRVLKDKLEASLDQLIWIAGINLAMTATADRLPELRKDARRGLARISAGLA